MDSIGDLDTGRTGSRDDLASSRVRRELHRVITTLLKAQKDIRFYPPNSPVIDESLENAVAAIRSVYRSVSPVVFEVRQRQFFVDNVPLFNDTDPECEFAEQLFGLGVRIIEIKAVPSSPELESFLRTVLDAHQLDAEFESLNTMQKQEGISSIILFPSERLDTVELGDVSDEHIDTTGSMPLWTAQSSRSDRIEQVADVLNQFADIVRAAEDDAECVLDHIRKTGCLASVARFFEQDSSEPDVKPVAETFFSLLDKTSRLANEQRPSIRRALLNELADVVNTMNSDMRNRFIGDRWMGETGAQQDVSALLSRLADDVLSDHLADAMVVHGGAEAIIETYFAAVPVPKERRENIVVKAYEKAGRPVADEADISQLLERRPSTATPVIVDDGTESLGPLDARELDEIKISPDEEIALESMVREPRSGSVCDNAATLTALLGTVTEPDHVVLVLKNMNRLLPRLVKSADGMRRATELVKTCLDKRVVLDAVRDIEVATELDRVIARASCTHTVAAILDMVGQVADEDVTYKNIIGYFRMLGKPSYRELVSRLRNETSRARRMAARRLIVSLGDACLDILAHDIVGAKWYVVRNVASILGDIRSPKSIEYLSQALVHADGRVRHEAVNALGKIGTPQAVRTMVKALRPDDPETTLAAVRWLGLLGDKDAVSPLIHLLDQLGSSPDDRKIKLSIIDALARTGSPLALAGLEKIKNARKLWLFKRDPALSRAASAAIETITNRIG